MAPVKFNETDLDKIISELAFPGDSAGGAEARRQGVWGKFPHAGNTNTRRRPSRDIGAAR